MTKTIRKLRVNSSTAQKLRTHLESADTLSTQDVQALLKILDDVYPRQRRKPIAWKAVFIGMAFGILALFIFLCLLPAE